jgi:folylpolyglutamate synthase/dihydropteroate synthase
MTTATTAELPRLHGDARRRAITAVGITAPHLHDAPEPTLVDLHPGPTREQLADQVATLRAENGWLKRQLAMRFEVLTLTVMHASFAETNAALDVDCVRWPTDAFGAPVDERGSDVPQPAKGGAR